MSGIKCQVLNIEAEIDTGDIESAVMRAVRQELNWLIKETVESEVRELVKQAMIPYLEEVNARIALQLKDQLDKIIVGRKA